jgi:uncharacterized membrane protein YjfL (UPF0719 family)
MVDEMILNIFIVLVVASVMLSGTMVGLYKLLDKVTKFDTGKQLSNGNMAVATVISSMIVGSSVMIGMIAVAVL